MRRADRGDRTANQPTQRVPRQLAWIERDRLRCYLRALAPHQQRDLTQVALRLRHRCRRSSQRGGIKPLVVVEQLAKPRAIMTWIAVGGIVHKGEPGPPHNRAQRRSPPAKQRTHH